MLVLLMCERCEENICLLPQSQKVEDTVKTLEKLIQEAEKQRKDRINEHIQQIEKAISEIIEFAGRMKHCHLQVVKRNVNNPDIAWKALDYLNDYAKLIFGAVGVIEGTIEILKSELLTR